MTVNVPHGSPGASRSGRLWRRAMNMVSTSSHNVYVQPNADPWVKLRRSRFGQEKRAGKVHDAKQDRALTPAKCGKLRRF